MEHLILAKSFSDARVTQVLKHGGVAVIPTDTIYGIVGSALKVETVARIYRLRKRNLRKPMIVLIASLRELARFGVRVSPAITRFLRGAWPGRVSVALPVRDKKWEYLHRGTEYVAFRVPLKKALRELLIKTGPLVAPSANLEGKPPAKALCEAKEYFGTKVDCYVDGGELVRKPSTLVKVVEGKPVVMRK
ncbi:MAG: threonylcarbamoyl-AMP synthase [Candidatus Liptonbacteria bacterium]|nr:threonylcarbamoyl-AMP synthase [Candidatus Liptonbacteria bacterium]